MTEQFTHLDAADYLNSDEEIQAYLEACIDEDTSRILATEGR